MANTPFKDFFGDNPPPPIEGPVKPDEQRVTGKIIKVSDEGWGFISSKDIKFTRIFFHWTSLRQDTLRFTDLKKGMMVEFTPHEIEGKGFRAIKIKVMESKTPKSVPPITTSTDTTTDTPNESLGESDEQAKPT